MKQLTTQDYIDAVTRNGGSRAQAAAELGVGVRNLFKRLAEAKKQGYEVPDAPPPNKATVQRLLESTEAAHHAAPEHYSVKGVSSLVDAEGNVKQQWIKTNQDDEQRMAMLRAACDALKEEIQPQCPIPPPAPRLDRLCNLYTVTDFHLGMLAWRQEGGADWDLQIAERTLIGCFRSMVANSPPSRLGIVNQLGDFLHTDGFQPLTPASKHVLDADSRYPKIVQVAVRSLRAIVNIALAKHERVHVLMAEGNHSPAGDVWLRALFAALYEDEPRATVDTSPLPYYALQWGKTMLAFHHSHLLKMDKLAGFMAAQFPQMWGSTTKRYCHTGHLHHTRVKEDAGMTVEQHPTLAARDAYAARGGWHAERAARAIVYHEEYGEVGRTTVTPEMIE
jgi:hypothetical protein